jgi:hypothetical protein
MQDLQKLFFEDKARVSDREVLVTSRLNNCLRPFIGQLPNEDTFAEVKGAIVAEMDRMIDEGLMTRHLDWLAAVVGRRLYVAYGAKAVQKLSAELKDKGAV